MKSIFELQELKTSLLGKSDQPQTPRFEVPLYSRTALQDLHGAQALKIDEVKLKRLT